MRLLNQDEGVTTIDILLGASALCSAARNTSFWGKRTHVGRTVLHG
ncbi:hypothetical protein IHE33_03870 [Mycetohabitans endofungorum]|nr:hypothetical protein [Mycetohabitans endofungorum]